MKKFNVNSVIGVAAAIMLTAGMAQAARIDVVQPSDAAASSQERPARAPDQSINGSGLSDSTIVETDDPVPDPWPTHNGVDETGTSWLSNSQTISNQWIMFDLDGEYEIEDLHVWNYNGNFNKDAMDRGINELDIKFATDSSVWDDPTHASWSTANSDITQFLDAPGADTYAGDEYSLSTPINAQYVLFDITSNHGGSFVGLSEVRFTATIPEPSSFLLLLLGATAVLTRRPRRRK